MSDQEHFLSRWARRKAAVAAAVAREDSQALQPREPARNRPEEPSPEDDDGFDLAALPKLEDLTAETDIRPFMHRLVPADLRNAALRRMWELDTAIRDYVSPATEYAWDFHAEGSAPGYSPLQAGVEALRMAERMFSHLPEDHTLVEGEDAAGAGPTGDGGKAEALPGAHSSPVPIADGGPACVTDPENAAPTDISMKGHAPADVAEALEPAPSRPSPPRRSHGGALPG